MIKNDSISKFFTKKNVLITGSTGFIGKVLLEKLLRSCEDIGTIFLLVRAKKGKSPEERVQDVLDTPLFDKIRQEQPNAPKRKIHVIPGDVTLPELGLAENDANLLRQEVNVVFHVAASVRFDDSLKKAVIMNVRGTRDLCKLALQMKNIKVFLHVSTAFCNSDIKEVDEKLYPSRADWKKTIDVAEKMDENLLDVFTEKYTGRLPNSYTFAKGLAEHVVNDLCFRKIPTVIIRPSIVLGTFIEPIPGWVDNFNGPTAPIVGIGKGALKTFLGDKNNICDFIPVDVCVKGMILAAWEKATNPDTKQKMKVSVYHACQDNIHQFTMKDITEMGFRIAHTFPVSGSIWYPFCYITASRWLHWFYTIFLHFIPALIIDGVLLVAKREPMLVRLQRKVYKLNLVLAHFTTNNFKFKNVQYYELQNKLKGEEEKRNWAFREKSLNPFQYFVTCVIGAKLYLLKEKLEDLEKDKRHIYRLWFLHIFVVYGFYVLCFWYVYNKGIFQGVSQQLSDYYQRL